MNTPSPWVRGEEHETKVEIWSPGAKRVVAVVRREGFSAIDSSRDFEDADLIAAAPEMLAALERNFELHDDPTHRCGDDRCPIFMTRAALKKAKGL